MACQIDIITNVEWEPQHQADQTAYPSLHSLPPALAAPLAPLAHRGQGVCLPTSHQMVCHSHRREECRSNRLGRWVDQEVWEGRHICHRNMDQAVRDQDQDLEDLLDRLVEECHRGVMGGRRDLE